MLRPRIIPCLLLKNGGLAKTVNFDNPKYVGDPLNAVRIFNEKEVDELIVLDIDATAQQREPDYTLIRSLAAECRMPLCYGGGIKTVDQIQRVVGLGVEKVAISSAAVAEPTLISRAAERVGSQSIVGVIDVRKSDRDNQYRVFTHNGTKPSGLEAAGCATAFARHGAGEILVNSIDSDGKMTGYDLPLIDEVRKAIRVPLTALGGAGNLDDIAGLIQRFEIIGAAAGSMFVFKGKYRAVLINYPNRNEKDALLNRTRASGITA